MRSTSTADSTTPTLQLLSLSATHSLEAAKSILTEKYTSGIDFRNLQSLTIALTNLEASIETLDGQERPGTAAIRAKRAQARKALLEIRDVAARLADSVKRGVADTLGTGKTRPELSDGLKGMVSSIRQSLDTLDNILNPKRGTSTVIPAPSRRASSAVQGTTSKPRVPGNPRAVSGAEDTRGRAPDRQNIPSPKPLQRVFSEKVLREEPEEAEEAEEIDETIPIHDQRPASSPPARSSTGPFDMVFRNITVQDNAFAASGSVVAKGFDMSKVHHMPRADFQFILAKDNATTVNGSGLGLDELISTHLNKENQEQGTSTNKNDFRGPIEAARDNHVGNQYKAKTIHISSGMSANEIAELVALIQGGSVEDAKRLIRHLPETLPRSGSGSSAGSGTSAPLPTP